MSLDLFVYKLTLAPLLVAGATLLGRRHGDTASGLVAGLPIVAGPILWFYALEQGPAFAVAASIATLLGIVSLCLFALAYAWRAWMGGNALSCLVLSWVAFAFGTVMIERAMQAGSPSLLKAVLYALVALFLAVRSLPPMDVPPPRPAPGPWDLPLRMAAAALLVWLLTRSAQALGPILGGLLTPFPVASTVLAVFAQRQGGGDAAVAVLKGLLLALNAFAAFCATLVLCLPRFGLNLSFALALAAASLVQAGVYFARRRSKLNAQH